MKKFISVLTLILIVCTFFAGCGNPEGDESTGPVHTCHILGINSQYHSVPFNSRDFNDTIYAPVWNTGRYAAIVTDGDPAVDVSYDIVPSDKNYNTAKKKQIAKSNLNAIISEVSQLKAQTPEIDTLKAIQAGADFLSSASDCEKRMIIYDSGLSTTGILNFAEKNLFDASDEYIVEQLQKCHSIPDLTGVRVTWVDIGKTCGRQGHLPQSYVHRLETLWNNILTAGGAAEISFLTSGSTFSENESGLPECTVVPVIEDEIDLSGHSKEIIRFDEKTSVKFKGDLAEFVDAAAAEKEMLPIAEYLRSNPGEVYYIAGMTATTRTAGYGKELSLARAGACKDILLRNGVGENQLICVGLGQSPNSLRVPDTDANGNQIEELAKLNRAVFFIKDDSPAAETVIIPNL